MYHAKRRYISKQMTFVSKQISFDVTHHRQSYRFLEFVMKISQFLLKIISFLHTSLKGVIIFNKLCVVNSEQVKSFKIIPSFGSQIWNLTPKLWKNSLFTFVKNQNSSAGSDCFKKSTESDIKIWLKLS